MLTIKPAGFEYDGVFGMAPLRAENTSQQMSWCGSSLRQTWDEITVDECATIVGNLVKRLCKCTEGKRQFCAFIVTFVSLIKLFTV